jgi:hypothetical protein
MIEWIHDRSLVMWNNVKKEMSCLNYLPFIRDDVQSSTTQLF